MKSRLYSLLLLFLVLHGYAQEKQEVSLQYSTAGYAENINSSSRVTSRTTSIYDLTPTVNSEMNVSESGALNYALPIEILKGLNDFQPNISLVYNSQSGNGQAGWGWNIIGLSNITRGGKSKEIDGITIGPQFNNTDPFYFDGQRLLEINTTTYVTEKFSKIKIIKPTTGEFSFIVQYTDGKVAKYKELLNGQNYISTFIDQFNNEIHYTYLVENNSIRVTKISYGGSSESTDKFYINFIYKDRKKNITIYRNGISFINTKVLSEINTGSTYVSLFRKYSLVHDFIEDNSVERLRTIVVSNEYGETLKPLNFNYNTSNQGIITISLPSNYTRGSLENNVTGLGSVTVGRFRESNLISPIFQVRKKELDTIPESYSIPDLKNVENDAGTSLFSAKVLDLEGKVTQYDQVIVLNEKYIGTENTLDYNDLANQQLRDELVFEIRDLVKGTGRKVVVPLKGGVIEVQNYIPDPYDDPYGGTYETSYVRDKTRRELIQGDFNNDGLVDFLIVDFSNLNRPNRLYLLELGKQNSGTQIEITPILLNENLPLQGKDIYPIEFNGDGVSELMIVDKNLAKYSVYSINFINNNLVNLELEKDLPNFGKDTPVFFGDFNGDGITDFLTPQKVYEIPKDDNSGVKMGNTYYSIQNDTLLWWKYIGNGLTYNKVQEDYTQQKIFYIKPSQSNYIKKSSFWQKFWNGIPDQYAYTRYSTHNITISDFNNDGRSDIIMLNKIGKAKYNANGNLNDVPIENLSNILSINTTSPPFLSSFTSTLTNKVNFFENKNLQGGTFQQIAVASLEGYKISPLSIILPKINFDKYNTSQYGILIFDTLTDGGSLSINNESFLEKQIQEINNGSDVLQKIEYRNMIQRLGINTYADQRTDEATYLYKPRGEFKYPFYVHEANSNLYLVNKIHTLFDNKILTKEYRYENGIQNFEGKGFLGFQKIYSSDAYESEFVNGRYRNINPVKALLWSIQTKDPLMDNATVKSTYGGITKFITENIITNKKFDRGNHQYLVLSTDEVSKDYLKKITISKKYVYDENDDLKLKTSYSDYNGIGSSISKYTYENEFSNGSHYFYGKIRTVENTIYKGSFSFFTKEVYDYFTDNGAIKENKKYGNDPNAAPLITSFTYDSIGNLKTQTISTIGITPQTTSYDYDATNRYINKTTTPDGLFSSSVVNALGRVSEDTSSLGLKTYYTYDSWGNITEITDYLNKKTTISKSVADASTGGVYNLHKKREGGTETIVTFDKFDREVQSKTQSINGKWLVAKTEYDIFGRKIKISEPFFDGETPKWNTVEYDELNRPIKNKTFTGKVIKTCYEGMKVTVDDGYKKTSKTLDAMGHTIRHQDHGGVINYTYYPNGALRETNYEGIKTTIDIDGWGNKKKIVDPSAGTFEYDYDNLNRLTKESNPKGYTLFSYDDLGRPTTETTYGKSPAEKTYIEKVYEYDSTTKLPTKITGKSFKADGVTYNNFVYTTLYDTYYRIIGKIEQTPSFTYSSSTTFDTYGRPDEINITTVLVSPSYTSSSKIKNVYDVNGILIQQNDVDSNKMVWHLSDINSRGQTTTMEYGNGYQLNNTYSTNNFSLQKINHTNTNTGVNLLDIGYTYDVDKGVLTQRHNFNFSKQEDFTYDKLNRLLTETVNNVLVNEYTYDSRGRITSNTELGKYNYNNTDYKLQNINFNTNGQNVNTQRGFASATYNAFKSPLRITLSGKEDLSFEYNILKGRYSTVSTVTGKTKYFSSDFAVEIIKENNGKTQIVTYITGDPYSANYIKKEVLTGTTVTEKGNYFLHRDNLGSIVAITNTNGSVVEKRFFDAWGNLKALVNAAGQTITDGQQLLTYNYFIDRGYTGHEHLWRAGLINMNARLYDSILRKFLSPDNYVQDPFNTQSYDRYSYVFNNPLLYTDPSGDLGVLAVMLIGAAVGVFAKGIANMIQGIPFWYGIGKAAVMGAVSGYISFGIGAEAISVFGQGVSFGKAIFEAGMHAISSGVMSAFDGGNGGAAMLSGLVSSFIASGAQALGELGKSFELINADTGAGIISTFGSRNPELLKAIMITSGGFSGGISSTLAGGNFWDGMRQGLITSGLNHALSHAVGNKEKTLSDYEDKINGKLDRRIDKLNQNIARKSARIDRSNNPDRVNNLQEKIIDYRSQLTELNNARTVLNYLLSAENSFNVSVIRGTSTVGDFTFYGTVRWGDNSTSLILNHNGINTIIHEMIHVYQIVTGEFRYTSFVAGEKIGFYGYGAEISAYRVTYSLSGLSGINRINNINQEYIKSRGY